MLDLMRFSPTLLLLTIISPLVFLAGGVSASGEEPMLTPWGEKLDKQNPLPEYPRPQLVREGWTNLNGSWDFAQTDLQAKRPSEFDEKILVPFPVESTLSGVSRPVTPEQAVWYRREFQAARASGKRLLLHFGAVDWDSTVWVNGREVGAHQGGFDSFSFDITDALSETGTQELVVRVTDPSNHGNQPHGKQSLEPGGIVYTAVTGIWQTVWCEEVPEAHVASLKLTPDLDGESLKIVAKVDGAIGDRAIIRATSLSPSGAPLEVSGRPGEELRLSVPNPKAWSPDDPYLYDLKIELVAEEGGQETVLDRVESYFGMRSVEVRLDEQGRSRICLNGEKFFSLGPLDQGWWPDGLYTAPSDEALRWDIELTKRFGFNSTRKHVKVEPARWYYWCDKLGLAVWQDMPNGDRGIGPNEKDLVRSEASEATYRRELKAMIDGLSNSPSVIIWVPFNEGWGQFKTNEILSWVKQYDPTRIVDGPSGWTDRGVGDLVDMHSYPGPDMHTATAGRVSVLGEFGGYGLAVPGSLWFESGNWGYQNMESRGELAQRYRKLIDNVLLLKREGLGAAIYTQITDVEGEVNGLATYDRKVLKFDPEVVSEWHQRLYGESPKLKVIVPSSKEPAGSGQVWSYTLEQPSGDWTADDYDDSSWETGRAGFGAPNTPGATVRTEWGTENIWLRRSFELDSDHTAEDVYFFMHHDEDSEVYVDGVKVAEFTGYTTDYRVFAVPKEAHELLTRGEHVIAIHCRQSVGGQYVDLGLVALVPEDAPTPTSLSSAE